MTPDSDLIPPSLTPANAIQAITQAFQAAHENLPAGKKVVMVLIPSGLFICSMLNRGPLIECRGLTDDGPVTRLLAPNLFHVEIQIIDDPDDNSSSGREVGIGVG